MKLPMFRDGASAGASMLRRRGCVRGCVTVLAILGLVAMGHAVLYLLFAGGYVKLPSEYLAPAAAHHHRQQESAVHDVAKQQEANAGNADAKGKAKDSAVNPVKAGDDKANARVTPVPVAVAAAAGEKGKDANDAKAKEAAEAKAKDEVKAKAAESKVEASPKPAANKVDKAGAQGKADDPPGTRKIKKEVPARAEEPNLPKPDCKEKKQYVFLHWDPHWSQHRIPSGHKTLRDCPQNCLEWVQTSDRSYLPKADIVAVHDWSGSPALPAKAHPNQLFMFITMESPYSPFGAQHHMHLFQLLYTYRLDSDVRATYIPIGLASYNEIIGHPPFSFADKHKEAVSSLVSNCGGFVPRVSFMEELSKHIDMHSFGACFHNHDLPSHHDIAPLGKYKFAMVFENSLCRDYVTEKFYRALTQATIPLVTSYKGIPDYRKYGPTLHSYVNIADYPDTKAVAEQLKKIANNENLYDYYLEHRYMKRLDLNPLYLENFANSTCDDFCRISTQKLQVPSELEKVKTRVIPQDTSCLGGGVLKG